MEIKKPEWQKNLTAREIKHLTNAGATTLEGATRNFADQAIMREARPEPSAEPCWDCRYIARKLGLPE